MVKKKFPPSYKSGYLKVSGGHEIYYELYGNPKGLPVLFFHGGPGGGFEDKHKAFFDPKKHNVLFFDQRGAGKSMPFASIKNNTTHDLIADARKLLDLVGFSKVFIFGGSWGSTLALLFAIKYPKMVKGLLLRGIFLGSKDEYISFYQTGDAIRYLFPGEWERFISLVPAIERSNVVQYYLNKMSSKDPVESEKYLYEWCLFEGCLMSIDHNVEATEKEIKKDETYKALSFLEAHYFVNNCFLEDNYILKNLENIQRIPTVIVQGRYDVVCPPLYAYKLHKALKNSKLYFVKAGHSSADNEIRKKLIEEMSKVS